MLQLIHPNDYEKLMLKQIEVRCIWHTGLPGSCPKDCFKPSDIVSELGSSIDNKSDAIENDALLSTRE